MDQEKARSHGIVPLALASMLRQQNFTLSGGHVREGGKKIYVRSLGKFHTLDEIRGLMVDEAHGIRLGDCAEVSLNPPSRNGSAA